MDIYKCMYIYLCIFCLYVKRDETFAFILFLTRKYFLQIRHVTLESLNFINEYLYGHYNLDWKLL